jgi:CRISPR/Cas system type I-B associated protein Csh2 (Cas7 group RAMP superfamily)
MSTYIDTITITSQDSDTDVILTYHIRYDKIAAVKIYDTQSERVVEIYLLGCENPTFTLTNERSIEDFLKIYRNTITGAF